MSRHAEFRMDYQARIRGHDYIPLNQYTTISKMGFPMFLLRVSSQQKHERPAVEARTYLNPKGLKFPPIKPSDAKAANCNFLITLHLHQYTSLSQDKFVKAF